MILKVEFEKVFFYSSNWIVLKFFITHLNINAPFQNFGPNISIKRLKYYETDDGTNVRWIQLTFCPSSNTFSSICQIQSYWKLKKVHLSLIWSFCDLITPSNLIILLSILWSSVGRVLIYLVFKTGVKFSHIIEYSQYQLHYVRRHCHKEHCKIFFHTWMWT